MCFLGSEVTWKVGMYVRDWESFKMRSEKDEVEDPITVIFQDFVTVPGDIWM